ncbi:MAG TPA: hypothetical protein VN966_04985 [Candidatus Bathyarchaeia archaeon]|nr:hypothetical protein [Candidatus Bathyarchaeia archaeon]
MERSLWALLTRGAMVMRWVIEEGRAIIPRFRNSGNVENAMLERVVDAQQSFGILETWNFLDDS